MLVGIIDSVNLSDIVAVLREKHALESEESIYSRLPDWIEDCFNLSYDIEFNF